MVYHFKVHKEDDGFWAECIELEGCRTQGDSLDELQANAKDAVDLFLSEPADSSVQFSSPKRMKAVKGKVLSVGVDPQVALAMRIRQARLKRKLTQTQVAKLMKIKNVSAYQKYENAKTCNPGIVQLANLKRVLPSLGVDDVLDMAD